MRGLEVEKFEVFREGGWNVVYVPKERGEELCIHLESHGIRARVASQNGKPYDRVEVEGDMDADDLQAIIDCWER